jgi:hypothetical protein
MEKGRKIGWLKIRTFTSDIERMQVFCAQIHVFYTFRRWTKCQYEKSVLFFIKQCFSPHRTYIRVYNTVYSSTNTGDSSFLQMNRKVELVGQA